MQIRKYKAKNELVGGVQLDKSVTFKSVLYYNAAHVFIHPCYILLFYPIHEGSRFLQNMGTQLPDWIVSHPRRQFYCHCHVILILYTCLYSPLPCAHAQTWAHTYQASLKSGRFILCAVFGLQLPTCACMHACVQAQEHAHNNSKHCGRNSERTAIVFDCFDLSKGTNALFVHLVLNNLLIKTCRPEVFKK